MQSNKLTKQTFLNFWKYTKPYLAYFIVGSGGAIIAVAAQSVVAPYIVSRTFSKLQVAYTQHHQLMLSSFTPYLLAYAGVMLIGVILWRLQSYFTWQLEIHANRDIIRHVFNQLTILSQRFHANSFSGALVSQSTKYVGAYERLMDDLIWNIVPGLSTVVFSIIVLSFLSPLYGLGMFVLTLIYIGSMHRRIIKQMPFNQESAQRESDQTAALADAITNIETIRAFGNEEYERTRFKTTTDRLLSTNRQLSKEVFKSESLSHIQTNAFQVIAVVVGLAAVTYSHANISLLYLLISYTQSIVNQIYQISRVIRNVNRSLGDASEMTRILGLSPEIIDPIEPHHFLISRGDIDFHNVCFSYSDNTKSELFSNLNLRIKPGEKVGLVGQSGGGKTTVTKLILRFMDITSGEITLDGHNIAQMSQSELRQRISYVPQEPLLFHRSLKDNIRYGNLQAQDEEIIAVAKMAHAHDFIEHLSHGYDTLVGERGIKLSGGQRQRIAIARAMLKNAPILLLDEATSALDSVSEALIQDALRKLMANKTALIIAHRLSTIQQMDRIIVMHKGEIAEMGTHKELLRLQGQYAELWARQTGGFMED